MAKLATASKEQLDEVVAVVVEEEAVGQPPEVKAALTDILKRTQETTRRPFSRPEDPSGRSVPGTFSIRSARDLNPLLPRQPRFKPGDRPLPGYPWKLSKLLGVGGFGEVWQATSLEMKNEPPPALKFCLEPSAVATLRREVTLLDQIKGQGKVQGIVNLLDVFLMSDPVCLVYEYVGGGDLTAKIQQMQRFAPEQRIDLAHRVISMLANIVGQMSLLTPPMVHRDLKPANVLVRPRPDKRLDFLVADFGIGAVVAEQTVQAERMVGHVAGRPHGDDGNGVVHAALCLPAAKSRRVR